MTIDVLASGPMFFLVKVNGGVSGAPEAAAVVSYTGTNTWQTCSFTFNSVRDSKAAAANGTYASFVIHPYWESAAQINFGTLRPARTLWVDNFALPTSAPALTTTAATAIASTTATMNGNISSNGGANITSYGFYWSTTSGFADGEGTQVVKGTTNFTGAISSNLTGLTVSTIYYYKAYATNSIGTTYGTQQSFTTVLPAPTLGTFTVPAKLTSDVPFPLTAPTSNSGGAFTYTSSNTAVATISGSTITIVGVGTSIITATQAANGAYGSGSSTASFVVSLGAAPTPTIPSANVISIYSDAYTPTAAVNMYAYGNATSTSIVALSGNNATYYNNFLYFGNSFTTINLSSYVTAHLNVWSSNDSYMKFYLVSNGFGEAGIQFAVTPNTWNSITIPLSSYSTAIKNVVKEIKYTNVNSSGAEIGGGIIYLDNVFFDKLPAPTLGAFTVPAKSTSDVPFPLTAPTSNSGGAFTYTSSNTAVATISGTTVTIVGTGTSVITANQAANGAYGSGSTTASFVVSAPSMQAAPLPPCRASSDVVASYNDVPYGISTTDNNWGANGPITEISFVGNNIKLITDANWAQIGFNSTTLAAASAAAMTFLHVDIYSTTASASQVKVYVNFLTTGYFPTPNGVWTSLDIPASSFGGFASVSPVKILLDTKGTFYVDNIYFYRVPATPTFTQVPAVCSGATMTALPTTSNNVPPVTGTWSPALNNTATTLYTFTTSGTCPNTTTMTITVNPTPITTPIYHE